MRLFIVPLLFVSLLMQSALAAAVDWREQARDLIDAGKKQAAFHVLEKAVGDARQLPDTIEKVNKYRFVGEFYCKLDACDRGELYFQKAMDASLALDSVWRKLSAVISVLELQQYTIKDQAIREPLLKQTLDAKLLPEMAENKYATEIGRYVKRFDGAERKTFAQLLDQIRRIKQERVRVKALYAMSEISFGKDKGDFISMVERHAPDAKPFEKLLWHAAMAQMFDTPSTHSNSQSHKRLAQQQKLLVPAKYKEKASDVLKRLP